MLDSSGSLILDAGGHGDIQDIQIKSHSIEIGNTNGDGLSAW